MRGVVRLSGEAAVDVLARITEPSSFDASRFESKSDPAPTRAEVVIRLSPSLGELPASALIWPTRRSYTGQPSVEIHTLGSVPVLSKVVECCVRHGATPARPGEFTMRAFLAGRMDLTQAEAVLGVIEAENPGSLDSALEQLAGNLSQPLAKVRNELIDVLADVEAGLDFVDEDIEFIADEDLIERLKPMCNVIESAMLQLQTRGGGSVSTKIVIRGEPNAGKSRLINTLAGVDAAIVADVAGTTRDVVSVTTRMGGYDLALQDTAGIEIVSDSISKDAQTAGDLASQSAAIRLWCVDASRADFMDAMDWVNQEKLKLVESETSLRASTDLFVATKADLVNHPAERTASFADANWIRCSAKTGEGIDDLKARIAAIVSEMDVQEIGSSIGTTARCQQSLQSAGKAIRSAIALTENQSGHEFVSAELRSATDAIGEVTGEIYNEDILDRVFGRFCIGK
jgi:tRNA modification GTPase